LRGIAPKEYTVTANPAKKPEVSASGPAFDLRPQTRVMDDRNMQLCTNSGEFAHFQPESKSYRTPGATAIALQNLSAPIHRAPTARGIVINDRMDPRIGRALLSLEGLSVGDAFGQQFFSPHEIVTPERIARAEIPLGPWLHTDDTEMAISIVEVLQRHGHIDQDDLARTFSHRYMADPNRGYGGGAKRILTEIYTGTPRRVASAGAFGGGSMGNGSAMRVAPLGAYFADDIPLLIEQAHLSAQVTHFHSEGSAGAIAVALAAAFASNHRGEHSPRLITEFFEFVVDFTPPGATHDGIARAMDLPRSSNLRAAIDHLGNGSHITCPDTVPMCLWLAARFWGNFREAMWHTVTIAGDIDTNCAMVGGITALSANPGSIPPNWLAARGPLPLKLI
jgi:ADP-ribosylglycohydrolase